MYFRLATRLSLRSRFPPRLSRRGERAVVLRTAGVFPPGHPTTRLCLELLKETLSRVQAASLLDLGCGSGVLALAGAALGVPRVTAVDLVWRAASLTRENARNNGLAAAVKAIQGTSACLAGPFDVVLANLPCKVLRAEALALGRLTGPAGYLILAGFRDVEEEALLACYHGAGFVLEARRTADEWPHTLPPEGSFTWAAWCLQRRPQGGPDAQAL